MRQTEIEPTKWDDACCVALRRRRRWPIERRWVWHQGGPLKFKDDARIRSPKPLLARPPGHG